MIELSNVTLKRGESVTLDEVSLKFGAGGITALIGPNGAGKSTLLHTMSGLLPPTHGEILVEGLDVVRARPQDRARHVALLTQSERVTARLTVRDLVSFGRWPHHKGRPTAHDHARVEAALDLFGLEDLAERLIETLSGGQRQRAFVAMAFAQDTPWILLDEPLAALDPKHARDLLERLYDLSRPGPDQRSVVIVLHDLSATAHYADRIVALKAGRLMASGPRVLAMTDRVLSDLFDTELRMGEVDGRRVVVPV